MKTQDIGNAKDGMDLLTSETDLADTARLDMVNVDLHEEGTFRSRRGARRLSTTSNAHSLWSPKSNAFGLYGQGGEVRRLDASGTNLTSTVLIAGLRNTGYLKWAEYADEVFFTNGLDVGTMSAQGTRLLGLPVPDQPVLSDTSGSLPAGSYSVGISYLDARGEESGLSPLATIACTGGISLTLPTAPAGAARVRQPTPTSPVGAQGSGAPEPAAVPIGEGGCELDPAVGIALVDLAAEGDRAKRKVNYLIDFYTSIQKAGGCDAKDFKGVERIQVSADGDSALFLKQEFALNLNHN